MGVVIEHVSEWVLLWLSFCRCRSLGEKAQDITTTKITNSRRTTNNRGTLSPSLYTPPQEHVRKRIPPAKPNTSTANLNLLQFLPRINSSYVSQKSQAKPS